MKRTLLIAFSLAVIAGQCVGSELRFSIGIRETNSTGAIGSNGGSANGIEWVGRTGGTGLDNALVPADNAWHQVTWDLNNDPIGGFAGATADGILTSTTGKSVLEHLRIANTADGITHYKVFIDDIVSTLNGTPTTVTDFESFATGLEAVFQEPGFSGSTSANISVTPNIDGVTTAAAFSGTKSYGIEFNFVSDAVPPSGGSNPGWVRLTTSNTPNLPNPVINVPNTSTQPATGTATLSMQIMIVAIPEPSTLVLLGIAAMGVIGLVRRR